MYKKNSFLTIKINNSKNMVYLPEPDHGKVGISAVWATMLEAILSPRAHMAFSGGPMNAILFLCKFAANDKCFISYSI